MASFREFIDESKMTVYRGTGPEGIQNMRPSEEGVYGPGIYFYDNEKDARVYAEPGGGVIVGEIDPKDPSIQIISKPVKMPGSNITIRDHKIIVVPDANKVHLVKILP